MMHYTDLRTKYRPGYLRMYADSFYPLVEAGWTVVPGPGQEEMMNAAPTADAQLGEGSPAQRSRRN